VNGKTRSETRDRSASGTALSGRPPANPAPHQAATGSAVVTMAGQTGSVLGVRLLVIFLTSKTSADPHHDFAVAWAQQGEPATPPAAG